MDGDGETRILRTVYLTPELNKRLLDVATQTQISTSELLTAALEIALERWSGIGQETITRMREHAMDATTIVQSPKSGHRADKPEDVIPVLDPDAFWELISKPVEAKPD